MPSISVSGVPLLNQSVTAIATHHMTESFSVSLNGNYAINQSIPDSSLLKFESYSVTPSVEYKVNRIMTATLFYTHSVFSQTNFVARVQFRSKSCHAEDICGVEMSTNEPVSNEPASVTLQLYWAMIVQRKWLLIGSILAGIAVAGVLCLVLPKSYRSSTLIVIENQKIPDDYVKGIGGASVEERLTLIQQQVMSRTLLSQIIEEFKLYEGKLGQEILESSIEKMRKAIKVETVGTIGARGKSIETITISFSNKDPKTAMEVTAKLGSLFIEENLKVREQLVTGVSTFLEQELHDAKQALEAQEQAISQYKSKHIGLLPEQMEANLRSLDRLQADLNATDELTRSLTDKVSLVEKSIKEYEANGSTHSVSSSTATSHGGMDPLIGRLRETGKKPHDPFSVRLYRNLPRHCGGEAGNQEFEETACCEIWGSW